MNHGRRRVGLGGTGTPPGAERSCRSSTNTGWPVMTAPCLSTGSCTNTQRLSGRAASSQAGSDFKETWEKKAALTHPHSLPGHLKRCVRSRKCGGGGLLAFIRTPDVCPHEDPQTGQNQPRAFHCCRGPFSLNLDMLPWQHCVPFTAEEKNSLKLL